MTIDNLEGGSSVRDKLNEALAKLATVAEGATVNTVGNQVQSDSDMTYSRATHGDLATFLYGGSVPMTTPRTLTFPLSEGVTGGIVIVRVREDANHPLTVRIESGDAPGTYNEITVEASTTILRKSFTGSWWTDMGNFAQNGNKVTTQSDAELAIATRQDFAPRLILTRNTQNVGDTYAWHAWRVGPSGDLIVRDINQDADRFSISTSGYVRINAMATTLPATAGTLWVETPAIADLNQKIGGTPSQSEVQAISDKVDAILAILNKPTMRRVP